MGEVEDMIVQLQADRVAAAARLVEVETAWREATDRLPLVERQYNAAGLAAVKAQGPGSTRQSAAAAAGVLGVAENDVREARVSVTRLGLERDQLRFRVEYLDMRMGQAQETLAHPKPKTSGTVWVRR